MKTLLSIAILFIASALAVAENYNIICFYDTHSVTRPGSANFTRNDLENSLEYCTHVIYGYIGMRANKFTVVPLDRRQEPIFQEVRHLKRKYSNVKFLVSLGGSKDYNSPRKYLELLEGNREKHEAFIKSAKDFVKKYHFDGLDLAYQLPRIKHHKQTSKIMKFLNTAKHVAVEKVKSNLKMKSSKSDEETKLAQYKRQLTHLITDLKSSFSSSKLMLTLTVLPNVNSSSFFDVPEIMHNIDFVTLAAFDFSTPKRSPKSADYLAPLFAPPNHKARNPKANVDSQVQYWLSQNANPKQINIGVAAHGRTWQISGLLKNERMPISKGLEGPFPADAKTRTPGFLSWPEICLQVKSMSKFEDKSYGNYAYRGKQVKNSNGLLVTYENEASVSEKASYVRNHRLGGVALFDISLEDFHGRCDSSNKLPLLKAIRHKLL